MEEAGVQAWFDKRIMYANEDDEYKDQRCLIYFVKSVNLYCLWMHVVSILCYKDELPIYAVDMMGDGVIEMIKETQHA